MPNVHFEFFQCASLNASALKPNEDRLGMTNRCAWVIDGATDLAEPSLVGERSGASWLAAEAHFALGSTMSEDCEQTCRDLFEHLSARFEASRKRDVVAKWEMPAAAFALAQLDDGVLEVAWAADCSVVKVAKGAHTLLTPHTDAVAERQDAESLGLGIGSAEVRSEAVIKNRRAKRMDPDYKAMSPSIANSLRSTSRASHSVNSGDFLLLMTDGFSAIFDRYGRYSYDEALEVILDIGLVGLAAEIRKEEARDSDCLNHPRFKVSDDASAILVKTVL